jgi:hypothetical protein
MPAPFRSAYPADGVPTGGVISHFPTPTLTAARFTDDRKIRKKQKTLLNANPSYKRKKILKILIKKS